MVTHNIILPSRPRIVSEKEFKGVYEIDGLYPGYGHTLGNSLRRIILSSLPGAAITSMKIEGVSHEFSTLPGLKEDIITLLLNLKLVRFRVLTDESQTVALKVNGIRNVKAGDLKVPSQVEVINADLHLATLTDKNASLDIEMKVEKGLGFVTKEALQKDKVEVGTIALDAIFTPIRRVNYEVENMRVGDRTDFNRLRMFIETDGIISPREALERSIQIMIDQLKAIVGFEEKTSETEEKEVVKKETPAEKQSVGSSMEDVLKTRIEELNLSARTLNALSQASIRTVGGLARKREEDLGQIAGMGDKGISEIKRVLSNFGIILK